MGPQNLAEIVTESRAAISTLTALAVQYSFSLVGAFILLFVGWIASRYLHRWTLGGMQRIHGFDVTLAHFLANVVRYAVMILVLVTVLGQFGVQTASIIAAMGAAGLAIGLALQGTLQNIAAGIMLLVLRPFRVGEAIETNTVNGTVQEIGLFATELRTGDGLFQLVPNSLLWNTPVKNFSRFPTRRFEITAVVATDINLRHAEQAILNVATRDTRVRSNPAPALDIAEITKDTFKLSLTGWLSSQDYGAGLRDLHKGMKMALAALSAPAAESAEDANVAAQPDQSGARRSLN